MEMKLISRLERDENKVDDNLIAFYTESTDTHFVPFTDGTPTSLPGACKVYCVKYPIR